MNISLYQILGISSCLFLMGAIGTWFSRKNVIYLFLCMELMLLGAIVNFVAFGAYHQDQRGQVLALFAIGVGAAKVCLGSALAALYFARNGHVELKYMRLPKE